MIAGYKQPFDWVTYFQETKSIPAPLHLFNQVKMIEYDNC